MLGKMVSNWNQSEGKIYHFIKTNRYTNTASLKTLENTKYRTNEHEF